MENRREKTYSFSYCLFAYIYKDIHERTNLPVPVDYTVPSTKLFKSEIGDCVLNVCRVHETFLTPVFSKVFRNVCTSETYFFEYVKWYYEKVSCAFTDEYYNLYAKCNFEANAVGPFFIKFLTLCSFIAELVRYCFGKKCYSFTSSGPTSLAEIVLTIPEIDEYFPSVSDTFIVLNRFCFDVMNDAAINANSLCDLFMQQSDILLDNCSLSHIKNSLPQTVLTLPSKTAAISPTGPPLGLSSQEVHNDASSRLGHSNKRKFDALNVGSWTEDTAFKGIQNSRGAGNESPESVTDLEKCRNFSNSPPECAVAYDLVGGDSSVQGKCQYCNEECRMYLDDFIDDFKETNYEDE